jgi:hypothetical protein
MMNYMGRNVQEEYYEIITNYYMYNNFEVTLYNQ